MKMQSNSSFEFWTISSRARSLKKMVSLTNIRKDHSDLKIEPDFTWQVTWHQQRKMVFSGSQWYQSPFNEESSAKIIESCCQKVRTTMNRWRKHQDDELNCKLGFNSEHTLNLKGVWGEHQTQEKPLVKFPQASSLIDKAKGNHEWVGMN